MMDIRRRDGDVVLEETIMREGKTEDMMKGGEIDREREEAELQLRRREIHFREERTCNR